MGFLDVLRKSCISTSFKQQLSSSSWVNQLIQLVRISEPWKLEETKSSEKIFSIRLLSEILKALPLAGNWKRFPIIVQALFGLLSNYLTLPKDFATIIDSTTENCSQ